VSPRDDLRERILREALDLFTESGYHATSLNGIAARLGISKAAIYHHFPSKRLLLAELATPYLRRLDEVVDSISLVDDEKTVVLDAYLGVVIEYPKLCRLLLRDQGFSEDPLATMLDNTMARLVERLSAGLDPALAARSAACTLGTIHGGVLDGANAPAERERDLIVRAARAALTAGAALSESDTGVDASPAERALRTRDA
jgi:AcrR family transcriptional regulator